MPDSLSLLPVTFSLQVPVDFFLERESEKQNENSSP
jgi:hypothetical protein